MSSKPSPHWQNSLWPPRELYLPQPLSEGVNKSRQVLDFQVSQIQLPWIFKNKKQLLSKELIWVSNLVQSLFCKTFLSCVQRYSKVQRSLYVPKAWNMKCELRCPREWKSKTLCYLYRKCHSAGRCEFLKFLTKFPNSTVSPQSFLSFSPFWKALLSSFQHEGSINC